MNKDSDYRLLTTNVSCWKSTDIKDLVSLLAELNQSFVPVCGCVCVCVCVSAYSCVCLHTMLELMNSFFTSSPQNVRRASSSRRHPASFAKPAPRTPRSLRLGPSCVRARTGSTVPQVTRSHPPALVTTAGYWLSDLKTKTS